jgi:ribosomal protein S18 acetylase RimI-like enzyme
MVNPGEPCGYCRIENKADAIKVHELVLLPQFQGKGIGSDLLGKIQKKAAKRKIPMILEVLKSSKAVGLYERLGFKAVGSNETHLEMSWSPNGSSSSKI